MKKVFMSVLVISLLLLGVKNVNAMTEAQLKTKLTQSITINGTEVSLTADEKNLVTKYLNEYEVSSKDADYISGKVDEAISILKSEGKTDFKELSSSAKTKLKALVSDVAANTSVNATVTNGSIVIYNGDGTVFAEVDKLVKQTGTESNKLTIVASIAAAVTLVGAYFVVRQVKVSE